MTCLNAQQRASLIRQDVHVNRIYPIMIMCELYPKITGIYFNNR